MNLYFEILFWVCAACVIYTYIGYALLLAVLNKVRGKPVERSPQRLPVSIILAAHNEEAAIQRRLNEFTAMLDRDQLDGEIIVVSDGSTDGTGERVREFPDPRVRVIEQMERAGKAAALNAGHAAARHEILIFADMRQTWAADAVARLLENFADPTVGAVSGELHIETAPGVLAGVGLYWRFEKWLRRAESRLHSCVGVTGAISAVRRTLFRPLPPGIILDDVCWPLQVIMQGRRVVFDSSAIAYDRLPPRSRDEMRRKIRTLAGNFQLIARLPAVLAPWRNPLCWQFISHKLLRLIAPWALLGMLVSSAVLPDALYRAALIAQLGGYTIACLGLLSAVALRSRIASAAASFLVLNTAAWLAFWVWITGRAGRSWQKVQYQQSSMARPQPAESTGVGSVA